jgi:acyl-coenzyme A thioesterase PaaI-like protein
VTDTSSERALRDAASVEAIAPGRYRVTLSNYYTVFGRPNGGYLQCVMANAALAAASEAGSTHQHATAVTTNYIGAPEVGPLEAVTTVRRVGRGASFVHVLLEQEGKPTTESLVTLGTLRADGRLRYHDATAPVLPALEECVRSEPSEINIMSVADLRLDPETIKWWFGEPVERAEIRGYIRLSDGASEWDAWSVLFASDALPPATFPIGSSGWVPTLQLSSYVRTIPTSEWLTVRQWCVSVQDDLVDERCELFDQEGRLVASSSQLAMVRFPQGA